MREMEFSRLNLRINASDGEDAWGESIAEFACDTRDLLENCLVGVSYRYGDPPTGDASRQEAEARQG